MDSSYLFAPPRTSAFRTTHAFIRQVEADDLAQVYRQMQGFVWSPNGEARQLIASAGVHHTSMSIGDVAVDPAGRAWVCAEKGWIEMDYDDDSLKQSLTA